MAEDYADRWVFRRIPHLLQGLGTSRCRQAEAEPPRRSGLFCMPPSRLQITHDLLPVASKPGRHLCLLYISLWHRRPAGGYLFSPSLRHSVTSSLGSAEALPLETASVDAAMAILTRHHWSDRERGFREMARVARHRVVILTWVPDANPNTPFWLTRDYFPEIEAYDRTIFPSSGALTAMLERCIGPTRMSPLMVPHDWTDGFLCACWRRPELYLDSARRAAISSFARVDAYPGLAKLRADLDSGRWTQRNGELLELDSLDAGYRLVTCDVANASTANS